MIQSSSTEAWYVFYCKSRAEKKLFETLKLFGFSPFLPLITVKRQWSDRIKKVSVPLFPNYIFVFCTASQVPKILSFNHVVAPVRQNGQWATLKSHEKVYIEQVLATGYHFELVETKIAEGDLVEVSIGALKGIQGRVLHHQGQIRVVIEVEVLNKSMVVTVPSTQLRKL